MAVQKPREIAVRVLQLRQSEPAFVEDIFERELAEARISPIDRALCQELVYGICRWQETLDWLIARKTEGREQKPDLEILLRLGLYQMFWLDRIPNHAAVHETVEIAKKMGFTTQAGFLNAVLRTYTRERTETEKLLEQIKSSDPGIGYSHPHWIYERWSQRWGAEKTATLMAWNNTPPKTFARANSLKIGNFVELTNMWDIEGVKYVPRPFDWVDDNLVFELESHPPLAKLKSFQKGFFYIQDPSTLLSVRELEVKPGQTSLDLCAAPGGKATYMAQLMNNRGKIFAQDIDWERLDLVKENYIRLGITCIETSIAPEQIIEKPSLRFDRILIDAPCSNTGVMRRRVDLRWRIEPDEIARLRQGQLDLLRRAAPRLKPGGTLVYSTCSLEPEENREVVARFLEEQTQFKLESERELLPFADNVDGAFVAKLKRSTE
ncbi:MAG: 16S rRNA (cytosine(967)-C(5))-methyltransferase RsmB [Verrucomicrobiota bacterium]